MRVVQPLSDDQGLLFGGARQQVGRTRSDGSRENPETRVCSYVRRWCEQRPGLIEVRRTHSGVSFRGNRKLYHGKEGGLDFTGGTCFGKPIAIETKSETGETRSDQDETIAKLREWGWIVLVVHSPGEFLREIGRVYAEHGHPIPFSEPRGSGSRRRSASASPP